MQRISPDYQTTVLPPIYDRADDASIIPSDMDQSDRTAILRILTNPYSLDPEVVNEYSDIIKLSNIVRLGGISNTLIKELATDAEEVAIIVPGSDGKLEKG